MKHVDTWEDFIASKSTSEFRNKYPEVVEYGEKLRGRIRGTGMHAAGVVTSKEPISKYAPIETRKDQKTSDRVPVVGLDMNQVEDVGLIKIDALGLKTLSVIGDALDKIHERTGTWIKVNDIPLDDRKVFENLSKGHTTGVFQAEAKPYTGMLKKMGVSNFDELVASNALVRPGAMNTIGKAYMDRKHGDAPVVYLDDSMKEYTAETFGTILYQEQVMLACVGLGGMSMSEADRVRKIIGKKKDPHEFDAFRSKFVQNASKRVGKDVAENLWHSFEAHAGYSFGKSHAVSYSAISYWTAWLKEHYPLEFIWSLLVHEKDQDSRTDYLIEAKRLGLKVKLPHVNYSDIDFTIQDDEIRFGLNTIKWVSDKNARPIVENAPYKSFDDFRERCPKVNKRAVESMQSIGALVFEDMPRTGNERSNLYENLGVPEFTGVEPPWLTSKKTDLSDFEEDDTAVFSALAKKIKTGKGWSMIEFVDTTGTAVLFDAQETKIQEGQQYVVLASEKRIMDAIPLTDFSTDDYIAKFLRGVTKDQFVLSFKSRKTKKGDRMANIVIAEDGELTPVVVFPKNYNIARSRLRPGRKCNVTLGESQSGAKVLRSV